MFFVLLSMASIGFRSDLKELATLSNIKVKHVHKMCLSKCAVCIRISIQAFRYINIGTSMASTEGKRGKWLDRSGILPWGSGTISGLGLVKVVVNTRFSGDPNVGRIQGTSLPTFGWSRLSKCW